jgi:hypothetical protein
MDLRKVGFEDVNLVGMAHDPPIMCFIITDTETLCGRIQYCLSEQRCH